jgi:5-methylcytosine-specific restriction enzyme A
MPQKLKRPCRQPGCPAVTHQGYCDRHRRQHHQQYRQSRTDKPEQAFYRSRAWREASEQYRRAHPMCEVCKTKLSALVHHVKPIKAGGAPMDPSNWQAVCRSCQAKVHSTMTLVFKYGGIGGEILRKQEYERAYAMDTQEFAKLLRGGRRL